MNETTKIELTEHEALMFVQFQKRFSFIQLLDSIGAFDIKGGSLTIHFDKTGKIMSVDKNERFVV